METSDGFVGAILGVIGTVILAFFAWLTQRSKGKVADTIAARGEWEKITNTLSADNKALREELASVQKKHVDELAEKERDHLAEIKAKDTMIEAMIRVISQNSQSKAQLVGELTRGSSGK